MISTNTITLQDQLFGKDIPDLQAILSEGGEGVPPLNFNAALVKGRSNYVCLRRWQYFRQRGDLSTDELRLAAKMLVWLPTSLSGERSELTITVPAENAAWSRVSAQSESCQPDKCEYFRRNQCYLYRARRDAESAHVVVVNHALLISDLATENRVLPEYQHLIVDEAHHLEDVATDQLGFAANQRDVFSLLEELSSDAGAGRSRDASPGGFLSTVPAHFLGSNVSKESQDAIQKQIGDVHGRLQRARQTVYEFFNLLTALVNDSMEEADDGYAARNRGAEAGLRPAPARHPGRAQQRLLDPGGALLGEPGQAAGRRGGRPGEAGRRPVQPGRPEGGRPGRPAGRPGTASPPASAPCAARARPSSASPTATASTG